MNRQQYDGQLRRQAMAYSGMVETFVADFWQGIAEEGFAPKELLSVVRHIHLIGSGDSYAAAVAVEACYIHYLSRLGTRIYVETPLTVSRYTKFDIPDAPAEQTVLAAISSNGFSSCMAEALKRGKTYGIAGLKVMEKADSEADYALNIHHYGSPSERTGCCGYAGALVLLSLLAAYIAELRGDYPAGTADSLADAMVLLGNTYAAQMDDFDSQAWELAADWAEKVRYFYGVGDGSDLASAYFFSRKIVEATGAFGGFTNSVDWRHNVKHIADAPETCVVFFGEEGSESRRSIAAAADEAFRLGFQVIFVGDVSARVFGIESPVRSFVLPKAPEHFEYLTAYFNHLPMDIFVSYLAAIGGKTDLRTPLLSDEEGQLV